MKFLGWKMIRISQEYRFGLKQIIPLTSPVRETEVSWSNLAIFYEIIDIYAKFPADD